MKNERLHNHPQLEKKLGLDENHVIINKDKFEELFIEQIKLEELNKKFFNSNDLSLLEKLDYSLQVIKRVRKFLKTDFTVKERKKMSKLLKKFLKHGYVQELLENNVEKNKHEVFNKAKNEIEKKELLDKCDKLGMKIKDDGSATSEELKTLLNLYKSFDEDENENEDDDNNDYKFIDLLFDYYSYPISNWKKNFIKNNDFMSLEDFRKFMLELFDFVSDYAKETDYSFFPENFFSAMSNSFFNFNNDENCDCNDIEKTSIEDEEDVNEEEKENIYYDGDKENNISNNDIKTTNEC